MHTCTTHTHVHTHAHARAHMCTHACTYQQAVFQESGLPTVPGSPSSLLSLDDDLLVLGGQGAGSLSSASSMSFSSIHELVEKGGCERPPPLARCLKGRCVCMCVCLGSCALWAGSTRWWRGAGAGPPPARCLPGCCVFMCVLWHVCPVGWIRMLVDEGRWAPFGCRVHAWV